MTDSNRGEDVAMNVNNTEAKTGEGVLEKKARELFADGREQKLSYPGNSIPELEVKEAFIPTILTSMKE